MKVADCHVPGPRLADHNARLTIQDGPMQLRDYPSSAVGVHGMQMELHGRSSAAEVPNQRLQEKIDHFCVSNMDIWIWSPACGEGRGNEECSIDYFYEVSLFAKNEALVLCHSEIRTRFGIRR
jgi:hypothetical protein